MRSYYANKSTRMYVNLNSNLFSSLNCFVYIKIFRKMHTCKCNFEYHNTQLIKW